MDTRQRDTRAERRHPPRTHSRKSGAPKPRKAPSTKRRRSDSTARSAVRASQRRAERQNRRPSTAPALVYTEPVRFNRSRFLVQLATVAAVVLALVLGMSVFFKVEVITVSGAGVYDEWTIREASGIMEGDSLLSFSRARAGARIRAELPYVDRVRIGIKLPNTVIIVVEELDVVYVAEDVDGFLWLITSEGRVVEQTDGGTAAGYTHIKGIEIEPPEVGKKAVAVEVAGETESTTEGDEEVGTAPVVVTGAQRLDAALQILRELEANGIVGEAASVDVSNLQNITLWYGQKFFVKLGDTNQMSYKIASMVSAIRNPKLDNGYGELDVSFTIWKDQVGYTPFD